MPGGNIVGGFNIGTEAAQNYMCQQNEESVTQKGEQKQQPISIFSKYDSNKNSKIELSDAAAKNFFSNGCTVQEDTDKNIASRIKIKISTLFNSVLKNNFKPIEYDSSQQSGVDKADNAMQANLNQFNAWTKSDYDALVAEAKMEIQKEIEAQKQGNKVIDGKTYEKTDDKDVFKLNGENYFFDGKTMTKMLPEVAVKPSETMSVTNDQNKNGSINGKVEYIRDDAGKLQTIKVTSDKTGNEFTYQKDPKNGHYVEIDSEGNRVKDKNGKEKFYQLADDGKLVRNNSDHIPNLNILNAEIPMAGIEIPKDYAPKSDIKLPENLQNSINKSNTETYVKNQGGKFIQREVNGEVQQIAVYKNEQGQTIRQIIKDDGSTEDLVATDTLGKNKYITRSEADKMMMKQFGSEIGGILKSQGAVLEFNNGHISGVKVGGKVLTGSALNQYVKNVITTTSQTNPVPVETGSAGVQYFNEEEVVEAQIMSNPITTGGSAPISNETVQLTQMKEAQHSTGETVAVFDETTGGSTSYNLKNRTVTMYDSEGNITGTRSMDENERIQTSGSTKIETPSTEPKNLNSEDIKQNVLNLKPGETYTYQSKISGESKPVTWKRNEDGTLSCSKPQLIFKGRIPQNEILDTGYSPDMKTKLYEDKYNSTRLGLKTRVFYDENEKATKDVTNLENYTVSLGAGTKEGNLIRLMNNTKASSKEIKDTEGNTILRFVDGHFENAKGKEIGDDKAYKILEKAFEKNKIKELIQNY